MRKFPRLLSVCRSLGPINQRQMALTLAGTDRPLAVLQYLKDAGRHDPFTVIARSIDVFRDHPVTCASVKGQSFSNRKDHANLAENRWRPCGSCARHSAGVFCG